MAVIGRHGLAVIPFLSWHLAIPAKIRFSLGSEDLSRGSGRPRLICKLRIAAKYTLIEPGFRPSSARYAAKLHKSCSETGKGELIEYRVQKSRYA